MKIVSFEIEESKVNKGMEILVATAENGNKYIVGGSTDYPPAIVPYDKCWDAIGQEAFKNLTVSTKK